MKASSLRAVLLVLAVSMPAIHGQPGRAKLDPDLLRQLIAQNGEKEKPTPEQQKMAVVNELKIDRSPLGILEARVEDARASKEEIKPLPEKPTPEQELEHFQKTAAVFRRDVILGRWDKVAEFFAALPKPIADETYKNLVAKIVAPVAINPQPDIQAQGAKPHTQPSYLPPMEWLGLAAAAPNPPSVDALTFLAKLLSNDNRPPEDFFDALAKGIRHFGGTEPADRKRAAELLLEVGFIEEAEPFLPNLAEAREKPDYQGINLIARHRAALAKSKPSAAGKDAVQLAWELSTSFLSDQKAPIEARSEALFRALSLIPDLGDDRGRDWLKKTFENPEGPGLELLSSLGTLTALNRENPSSSIRFEQLRLQHAAVKAMLASGADPALWADIFTLYARQWVHEAEVTRQLDQGASRRMVPQYDNYGNVFFTQNETQYRGDGTSPISSADMLECRPEDTWLATLEPTTRHECNVATARLFLNVKEEDNALPLIRAIAVTRPEEAVEIVREVIRIWAENHNPNSDQEYRSRYMYYYGYNSQAGSIPLTRSKQERNLVELATLVKGIRSLGLDEAFDEELANAFIACHSKAEVWRVESIESVFGSTDVLNSATLASLTDRMRTNLAGLWPNPKLQQAYQTKRKDVELQEQILQGYVAATTVLESALEKKPTESWRLAGQLAAVRFDESNYRSSLAPDKSHTAVKRASLDAFAAAAADYAATLPLEDSNEESSEIFEMWFYAAVGSPTLEALKGHHLPTVIEYPKIKAALESLPGDTAERHLKAFATTLNTRLANVGPDLKLRYLEGATAICPDRKELADSADVLAYYRDLVTEIELSTRIDGPDKVSPDVAFGLQVNLRHTSEIERESGGFQRYLQNQTNAQYSYNFGRPAEDYRDKFEKAARAALEEHFEILSLTFHSEKVESRTDPRFGWRLTPYAYFLLKPKGQQVDRIPPLKIDLDFMDTSGYAVIPITSAEIPISASGKSEPRPFRELRVVQTLDERTHAEEGSLMLEIRATGLGLVPPIEELMDVEVAGFEVAAIENGGVRISELDANTDDLAPISEAEWRVKLKPIGGKLPVNFRFPALKVETAKEDGLLMQRYVDVDLVPVSAETPLGVKQSPVRRWIMAGAALLIALAAFFVWRKLRRSKQYVVEDTTIPLPTRLTPVTVLGYLQRLKVPSDRREELDREIHLLESRHFGPSAPEPDAAALTEIATRWQSQTAAGLG